MDGRYFLKNLRPLRERAGLSGYELAYIAGISAASLYAMEIKPTNPRYKTLTYLAFALALELDCPPREVFRELLDGGLFEPYADYREKLIKLKRTP